LCSSAPASDPAARIRSAACGVNPLSSRPQYRERTSAAVVIHHEQRAGSDVADAHVMVGENDANQADQIVMGRRQDSEDIRSSMGPRRGYRLRA
jgi:hypothetical protein